MVASPTGLAGTDVSPARLASPWSGFAAALVGTAALAVALLVGALFAIDPYATGRGLLRGRALHEQLPFTAHASRATDPAFDAAIFGNSHVQQLNPERLDRLTGLSVLSLAMPATYALDQIDVLRWFLANRRTPPRAIVIGMDEHWCLPVPVHARVFPAWLYATRFTTYLAGLVRYRNFEVAAARLRHIASGKPGIRRDGYWDYGPIQDRVGLGNRENSRRRLALRRGYAVNPTGPFPALDRLDRALAGSPAQTAVILLRTPVYRTALPDPGAPDGLTAQACGARMGAIAAGRPRTAFLDLFGRDADDPDAYYDHDHYRDPLAAEIERDVAASLAELGVRPAATPAL